MKKNINVDKLAAAGGCRCSGSCDGKAVDPIECPAGYSCFLDCVANPPRLKCVKDAALGSGPATVSSSAGKTACALEKPCACGKGKVRTEKIGARK